MDNVRCGTFMDWSFGGVLRKIRIHNKLTMRKMCARCGMDVGNYSRLEAGKLAPPKTKAAIMKIIKGLDVYEHHEHQLFAAAYNFHLGAFQKKFRSE